MVKKLAIVCMVVILGAGSVASAVYVVVPPWRGDEGSTFQEWTFSSPETNPPPDNVDNPYGEPLLNVGAYWFDDINGRQGAWGLSGKIDVYIPNRPQPFEWKWIWLQLTWKPAELCPDPFVPDEPVVSVTPFEFMVMEREDVIMADGWVFTVFYIDMSPNPLEEWITITGDILVDELIIDTICIPEPAMIFLLGLGGLALLRKRRA